MNRFSALLLIGWLASFEVGGLLGKEPQLENLRIDGVNWTCTVEAKTYSGILLHPPGEEPFPAMIISHGMGSNAAQFGRAKAREFLSWGFVCVATDYTHARPGRDAHRSEFGASNENLTRARVCLEILKRQPNVDAKRIVAYGNSMGAFLTIGLLAEEPDQLAGGIITAGGVVAPEGQAAPSAQKAKAIRAPMLILHGAEDATVPAQRSALLKEILDQSNVANERVVVADCGHGLHQQQAALCYAHMRAWLVKTGVLKQ